jgi:hypothetical protein
MTGGRETRGGDAEKGYTIYRERQITVNARRRTPLLSRFTFYGVESYKSTEGLRVTPAACETPWCVQLRGRRFDGSGQPA